ncbi:hypothetical protein HDU96_010713 [Phlyctochytrium bullatum]|nr:hypothetical protein HDU96_010713 [Phlyctochytrium bullatum]
MLAVSTSASPTPPVGEFKLLRFLFLASFLTIPFFLFEVKEGLVKVTGPVNGYADCLKYRKEGYTACTSDPVNIPAYRPGSNVTSENCINASTIYADKCVIAVDHRLGFFTYNFIFPRAEDLQQNPKPEEVQQNRESNAFMADLANRVSEPKPVNTLKVENVFKYKTCEVYGTEMNIACKDKYKDDKKKREECQEVSRKATAKCQGDLDRKIIPACYQFVYPQGAIYPCPTLPEKFNVTGYATTNEDCKSFKNLAEFRCKKYYNKNDPMLYPCLDEANRVKTTCEGSMSRGEIPFCNWFFYPLQPGKKPACKPLPVKVQVIEFASKKEVCGELVAKAESDCRAKYDSKSTMQSPCMKAAKKVGDSCRAEFGAGKKQSCFQFAFPPQPKEWLVTCTPKLPTPAPNKDVIKEDRDVSTTNECKALMDKVLDNCKVKYEGKDGGKFYLCSQAAREAGRKCAEPLVYTKVTSSKFKFEYPPQPVIQNRIDEDVKADDDDDDKKIEDNINDRLDDDDNKTGDNDRVDVDDDILRQFERDLAGLDESADKADEKDGRSYWAGLI